MARAIVIYESKYGNTRLMAEKIAEGIRQASGVEAEVRELKEVNPEGLPEFDAIVIGSPNHMGNATRSIRKFIDELAKFSFEGKLAAVFDTYMGKDFEKAVKKMEKQIGEKAPSLSLAAPGLSVRVEGMKGPITEGELPRCQDFGIKIGNRLKA
ncbi:MAG: flavodoxin domain-containing protein [Dehalococcoidales bacterium]